MAKLTSLKTRVGYVDTGIAAPLPQSLAFSDARRGSATSRGYGWAWQKLRTTIMKRDGYQCQVCKRQGRVTPADAVDHIVNKMAGGDDSPANLQAICNPCHAVKTAGEGPGGARNVS